MMRQQSWALEAEAMIVPVATARSPELAGTRRWSDWLTLTKPRITALALFTVGAGYVLGAGTGQIQLSVMLHVLIGAGLVAAAGGVFNQLWERHHDARMPRTRERPLPAGRVSCEVAAAYGASLLGIGLAWLTMTTPPAAGLAAAATFLLYVFVYTPLKRHTVWNTVVGAIPGALPPVIGWCAARGTDAPWGAIGLFSILFLWQIPHFMAIAWRYRREYAAAGYRMLPNNDPTGWKTAAVSVFCCVLLLAVGAIVAWSLGSRVALVGALASGVLFLLPAVRFARQRTDDNARRLLRGSLLYVPLVYGLLVLDAGWL
ncbi:MAG: heme o synthase [Gemmataceae bacterium]|nr:heme o synthase [Gemmataceae bacterium]MCS7270042.1 heme o synthase [Gemmataceae bacterium]MDW8243102.1 heme o synthase [Thermogemmata sp.]